MHCNYSNDQISSGLPYFSIRLKWWPMNNYCSRHSLMHTFLCVASSSRCLYFHIEIDELTQHHFVLWSQKAPLSNFHLKDFLNLSAVTIFLPLFLLHHLMAFVINLPPIIENFLDKQKPNSRLDLEVCQILYPKPPMGISNHLFRCMRPTRSVLDLWFFPSFWTPPR